MSASGCEDQLLRRSNVLSENVIAVMRGAYDVGDWLSWTHESKGRTNTSFVITAATGKYVLRRSNRRKSIPDMLFETDLMRFLRDKGYPAPEVINTCQGHRFAEHGETFYLLCRFINGTPFDPGNPAHLAESGRGLACYHRLVRGFPRQGYRQGPPVLSMLAPKATESFVGVEIFANHVLDSKESERVRDLFSYIRGAREQIYRQLEDIYPELSKLVIHASYGQSALLFENDALVGVLDYDRATDEIRALDVAYSTKELCHTHGEFRKEGQVSLDYDCCRRFLNAYREIEPLADSEARVLPLVFRTRHMLKILDKCIHFLMKDLTEPRSEKDLRKLVFKLERETAWIRWLEEHGPQLVSALRND